MSRKIRTFSAYVDHPMVLRFTDSEWFNLTTGKWEALTDPTSVEFYVRRDPASFEPVEASAPDGSNDWAAEFTFDESGTWTVVPHVTNGDDEGFGHPVRVTVEDL